MHKRKLAKYQTQSVLWAEHYHHCCCFYCLPAWRKSIDRLSSPPPLFFRATTGLITTLLLKVRMKKKKNFLNIAWKTAQLKHVGGGIFFFFFRRLFILERCAGVGQYLSEHPLTLFAHSLSNRSLMLSHVCARGLWYCSLHTHTNTDTHSRTSARHVFFGLSSPSLPPPLPPWLMWERLIRRQRELNK